MLKFKVNRIDTEECDHTKTTMIKIKSPVDNHSHVSVDLEFSLSPYQKEQLINSLLRRSYD